MRSPGGGGDGTCVAASSGGSLRGAERIYALPWPRHSIDGGPPEQGPGRKETSEEKARHTQLIGEHGALWLGPFPVCPPKHEPR